MSSRTRKTLWVVCFLVLATLLVAACGGGGQAGPVEVTVGADGMVDTSALAQDPPYTVCFSNASVSNSWRVMMNAHVDWAIEEATAAGTIETYRYADANDDPAKQISDVEDLLTQGCDVLILSAAASDVVDPAAQSAMEAGVPVVTLDRDVADPAHRVSYVQGDNCLMGTNQATWLVEQLGGEGQIVELSGAAGASPAEERLRCANEVFAQNPGIEILQQAYTGWSPTEGQNIMANWITLYPEIDGIWSDAGLQGSGAVEAYLVAGLPVPPITGEDFQRFLHQWVDNDLSIYTYSFSTRQGYEAVQVALDILRGTSVPTELRVPGLEITSANLMEIYNPNLPDEAIVDALPEVLQAMYPEAFQ
jgi:ribose transport system substrate-binding protein